MTAPLTLDAKGVAELVGWHHRNGKHAGQPDTAEVYAHYRDPDTPFPEPINSTVEAPQRWRWSRREIETWCHT